MALNIENLKNRIILPELIGCTYLIKPHEINTLKIEQDKNQVEVLNYCDICTLDLNIRLLISF